MFSGCLRHGIQCSTTLLRLRDVEGKFTFTFTSLFLSLTIMVTSHEDLLLFLEAMQTSQEQKNVTGLLSEQKKIFPAKIVENEMNRAHSVP
jgi:hypothetical protein